MGNILKTLFTAKDNSTYDIGRVLWALGMLGLVAMQIKQLFSTGHFEPEAFATAVGIILTTGAAALGIKKGTEPGS